MQRSPYRSDEKRVKSSLNTSRFSPRTHKIIIQLSQTFPSGVKKSGENFDESNLGSGMRDILLVKCKQAIEELHLELDEERKVRATVEESLSRLERDIIDKDAVIRDLTFRNEKLNEDSSELKNKNISLQSKLDEAEEQISYFNIQEKSYKELQVNFQEVFLLNGELKLKIDKLNGDIRKRDQVVIEWNDTLGSIDSKIATLEADKEGLQKENSELLAELKTATTLYRESENLNQLLQGKCEYSERLADQLERENKIIEELKTENRELQFTIERLKDKTEKINRDVSETLQQQDREHFNERDRISRELQKGYEENLADFKREHQREIDRLEMTVDSLRSDLNKLLAERDYIKQDFKLLNEKFHAKEREAKEAAENFNNKWDQTQIEKLEEIKQLKGVIDEQSGLISSYERMVEKEKRERDDEVRRVEMHNRRLKDEIQDLHSKNSYLSSKLQECQDELSKIQEEIKHTFSYEEERNAKMQERITHLEHEVYQRDTQIDALKEEAKGLKDNVKLKKKELESAQNFKKDYNDELFKIRSLLSQSSFENEELKDKQKEFDIILRRKMEEMTEELRKEREKRIQAEHQCTGYQEQINQLETNLNKTVSAHRNDLLKKDEEIDQLRYQRKIETVKDIRSSRDTISKRVDSLDKWSRSPKVESSRYQNQLSLLKSAGGSAERDPPQQNYRAREPVDSRKKPSNRFADTASGYRGESERPQHTEFINRFKDVISKLENRIEKISSEMY